MSLEMCCKEVWFDSWHQRPCKKKAVTTYQGKPYCKVHDPLFIQRKREDEERKWNEEYDAKKTKHERQRLEAEYCKGLTNDELKLGRILTPHRSRG